MPRHFTGSSVRVEDAGALAPWTRADHLLEAVYESERLILVPPERGEPLSGGAHSHHGIYAPVFARHVLLSPW